MSGVMVVTHGRTNTLELVCSDRDADTAATDQDSTLCGTGPKILSDERGVIRIIVRLVRFKGSYIVNRMAEFLDEFDQLAFHLVTCVICPDGNLHGMSLVRQYQRKRETITHTRDIDVCFPCDESSPLHHQRCV